MAGVLVGYQLNKIILQVGRCCLSQYYRSFLYLLSISTFFFFCLLPQLYVFLNIRFFCSVIDDILAVGWLLLATCQTVWRGGDKHTITPQGRASDSVLLQLTEKRDSQLTAPMLSLLHHLNKSLFYIRKFTLDSQYSHVLLFILTQSC